jgi:hypothetical protein
MVGIIILENHSPDLPGGKARLYLQNSQNKKGWKHNSTPYHRPLKREALSSNPSTARPPKYVKEQQRGLCTSTLAEGIVKPYTKQSQRNGF